MACLESPGARRPLGCLQTSAPALPAADHGVRVVCRVAGAPLQIRLCPRNRHVHICTREHVLTSCCSRNLQRDLQCLSVDFMRTAGVLWQRLRHGGAVGQHLPQPCGDLRH